MASSSSHRAKRTAQQTVNKNEDSEDVSPSKKGRLCIICGLKTTDQIVKDAKFEAMLQVYWLTVGIDVKPEACRKSDICQSCFEQILYYFETNDIMVYFENMFKSMRSELLKKTLSGVAKWERAGQPLTRIQLDIKNKYGDKSDLTEREEEQVKQTLDGYDTKMSIKEGEKTRTIQLIKKTPVVDEAAKSGKKDGAKREISLKSSLNRNVRDSSDSDDSD